MTFLQISISIVDETSAWAVFLEKFGEIPGLLVLLSAIYIYQAQINSRRDIKSIIITIIFFLAALFISGYLIVIVYRGFTGGYRLLMENLVLLIAVVFFLNLVIVYGLKQVHFPEKVVMFSKVTALLGLYGYLFLIQPFKILWGRVRFRDLDPLYESFTSWFIPNGITGDQSFPSGHSAMGWMILPLLLLMSTKSKTVRTLVVAILSCWALAVGLSRVVIGAHFASDVLFGAFFIIIVYIYLSKYYLKKIKTST